MTIAAQDDPIRAALIEHGLRIEDHYLENQHGGGMYLGPHFRIRSCEMIYSLEEPGDLLIVLYRGLQQPVSIKNPFADLIWFLQLATQPQYGVQRVLGYISTFSYRHENGLSEERLVRFYQRFFRADWIEYDHSEWLYRDCKSLRTRLARVQHLATRW
jgi:type III secretion system regulator LcrR